MNQPKHHTLFFLLLLILAINIQLVAQQNSTNNQNTTTIDVAQNEGGTNTTSYSTQTIINGQGTAISALVLGGGQDSITGPVTAGQVTTGIILGAALSSSGGPTVNSGGTSNTTTTTNCPTMYVDVDIPFLQSCVKTNSVVSYCNHGTAAAYNAYVDVTFDAVLTLDSASLPYTFVSAHVYRFQLGTVLANDCGSFKVFFTTACDSALINDEHCIKAHVYPDTLCTSHLIDLDATCLGTSISFDLTNKGTPITVATSIRFIIIDDHLLVQGGGTTILHQGILKLGTNQTETFNLLNISNSSSNRYKLLVKDSSNNTIASTTVENCTGTSAGVVSSFYATSFWNGSNLPSEDQGCAINGHSPTQANAGNQANYGFGGNDSNGNNTSNSSNSNSNSNSSSTLDVFSDNANIVVQAVPNPFLDYTTIILNGTVPSNYTFKMYDLTGRTIEVQHLVRQQEFRVERNNLLAGIYIYQIESNGKLIGAGKIVAQ